MLTFQIYNDFLDKYQPVSKFNRDYCYAIYLSLLYDNIRSVLNAEGVKQEQKLMDILEVLCAKQTHQMLTEKFDPEFHNLAHREDFLKTIEEYIKSLPFALQHSDIAKRIQTEMRQYSHLSTNGGGINSEHIQK